LNRIVQCLKVAGNTIEKLKVCSGIENPLKGSLDEIWATGPWSEQLPQRRSIQAVLAVYNRCDR
jgi:hypothetical protein